MLGSILNYIPSKSDILRAYNEFPVKTVVVTGTVGAVAYAVISGNGKKIADIALVSGRVVLKSLVKETISIAISTILVESVINLTQNSNNYDSADPIDGWASDSEASTSSDDDH